MPIKNYSTTIDPMKTAAEVQALLARKGARSVHVLYDNGAPEAIEFSIIVREKVVEFRLPANHLRLFEIIKKDRNVPLKNRTVAQARRIAWRVLKDWVDAQLAIIEIGMVDLEEVFMPYAITNDGRTLYDAFKSGHLLKEQN
jgi:hypothetical protein